MLKCSPLQQASLLAVNLNELVALVAYIRQSLCGFDGTILLVCCTDAVSAISSVALASSVMPISPEVGLQFYEPFTFGPLMSPPSVLVLTSEQPATIIGNSEQPTTVTMLPQPVGPGASTDAVCGISNFTQTRVVGGMNAKLSKYVINTTMYAGFRHCFFSADAYPWIAILAYQFDSNEAPKYLCAGSLVSQRFILTTAHCVKDELQYARLGEHDLASDADGANPLNVPIVEKIVHSDYVANAIINDIALLRSGILVPISGMKHNNPLTILN